MVTDDEVDALVEATNARRPFWRRYIQRRENIPLWFFVSIGMLVGYTTADSNSHRLDNQQQAEVDANYELLQTVCDELQRDRDGFRLFVTDLLLNASQDTKDRINDRLDERTPAERACADVPNPKEP